METVTAEKHLEKILDEDVFFRGMKEEHLRSIAERNHCAFRSRRGDLRGG